MVDSVFLRFDSGISRVVWDAPGQAGTLPDRRQLPPSELAATQQLNRLLLSDNIANAVAQAMRPQVRSRDVLQPHRFKDAMRAAGRGLKRTLEGASGTDRQALEELDGLLAEHEELEATLDYYRDMLIAG
jgi:hypothetical protein